MTESTADEQSAIHSAGVLTANVEPHQIRSGLDTTPCACDCGQSVQVRDSRGRPRQYAHGHNAVARLGISESIDDLRVWLEYGCPPGRRSELARQLGVTEGALRHLLAGRTWRRIAALIA